MENINKVDKRLNKSFVQDRELKEFCRYAKKNLTKHIQFKQHHNAVYDKHDILDLLLQAAMTNTCLESSSNTIKHVLKRRKPSADSVLRYIGKFSQSEVIDIFQRTCGYLFKIAKKMRVFNRPVDIAIDCHDIHYYGDKNDVHVVEGKPDKGTIHYFRFITLTIVEKGRRFTLRALPVNKFSIRERQIENLLNYATTNFKIRYVYMDAGFFDNKIIKLLHHFGLKYVIRASANKKIKKLTGRIKTLPIVMPYFLAEKSYTRLIVVKFKRCHTEKEIRLHFLTNIPSAEVETIERLYTKRWGIETSYRVKKHSFRIKTTSRSYIIRTFLFMFSVALYNLWYLANIMIGWRIRTNWITPFISAKIFISILLHVYVPPLSYSGGYG